MADDPKDIEQKVIINYETNAKQTEKEVGSLTKELDEQKEITIEFQEELLKLERQLKSGPKKSLGAQKALKKRITGLKDAIKDQRVALKRLNAERSKQGAALKTQKATEKLNKGYFKTQKSVTDVNALTRGYGVQLQALRGTIIGAGKAVSTFVKGLNATKKALLATGIGILVVALGLIAAHWEQILDFINGTNKALERKIKLQEKAIEGTQDELDLLDAKQKVLEAEGKSTIELRKEKGRLLLLQQEENILLLESLEAQSLQTSSKALELSFWEKILGIANVARGLPPPLPSITEEEQTRLDDIDEAIQNSKLKAEELKLLIIEINKPSKEELKAAADKKKKEEQDFQDFLKRAKATEDKIKKDEEQREKDAKQREADNETLREFNEEQEKIETDAEDLRIANAQKAADKEAAIEKALAEQKKVIRDTNLNSLRGGLKLLGDIFGANKKVQKGILIAENALGIAQTVIKTQASNAITIAEGAALAIPSAGASVVAASSLVAANNISAGISIAAIVAATAKGLSTLGGGGGSSAGGSRRSTGASATPQVGFQTSAENQIATTIADNTNELPPQTASVFSKEVETALALDRNKIQSNSIG